VPHPSAFRTSGRARCAFRSHRSRDPAQSRQLPGRESRAAQGDRQRSLFGATNNAVRAALQASIAHAAQQQHGLRIVFSLVPTEQEAGPVRLSEIPIEALYEPRSNFLAPQINTPVSRSLQAQPDRDPVALTPPLRVLVIAAGPTGLPPADIAQERAAITDALANLVANRIVELDFCDPPTRVELARRFTTKYHVVHFVGHGGVGRTGSDPSPRAFVFLQDANKKPDPLDGESLDLLLRNNPSV
jgi:CHAT domain